MSAAYFHDKGTHPDLLTGIHTHPNRLLTEREYGTAEPEILCIVHELQETWGRKYELVKEGDLEPLKERGGDVRKKCLQVSASTFEPQIAKVRKRGSRHDGHMQRISLDVTVVDRGIEGKCECLQLRYE